MEEQILKIMDNELMGNSDDSQRCAEKISTYVFEFIEWLHDNTDDTRVKNDKLWWCIPCEYYDDIEDIYDYWIKTK